MNWSNLKCCFTSFFFNAQRALCFFGLGPIAETRVPELKKWKMQRGILPANEYRGHWMMNINSQLLRLTAARVSLVSRLVMLASLLFGQVSTRTGRYQLPILRCTNVHLWRYACPLFRRAVYWRRHETHNRCLKMTKDSIFALFKTLILFC